LFNDWLPFAFYGFFALVIPSTMIFASFALATRPKVRVRARTLPFESGVSTGSPAKQRFTVSFYLTAMLFILFDIEIVFLYPLAVILHELAWFGFLEFLVFLVILLIAYVYIWRKGALEWR
jgi:NADH-quinone oxidoreductase subunit A